MAQKSRLGDILVKAKVLDELQLRSALATYDQWGGRLGKVISEMGLADEETIADAVSRHAGALRMRLGNLTRDAAALAKIDVAFAEQKAVFPVQLKDNGKTLVLAMADPTDLDVIDQAAMKARARIVPAVAGETEIAHAILRYYRGQDPKAAPATRARNAVQKSTDDRKHDEDEEEEFKVTDMSGKTVMKRIADIVKPPPPAAAIELDVSPPPSPEPLANARDLLEEILSVAGDTLSPEERTRLESVRANQQKSGRILRAVVELLAEKGVLSTRELQTRIKP